MHSKSITCLIYCCTPIVAVSFLSSWAFAAPPTLDWSRQFGTSSEDFGTGVSADVLGNVYITGYTGGVLGESKAGAFDAYVRKYDPAGTLQWTQQLGTSTADLSMGVAADQMGHVYITGRTLGVLGTANEGGNDIFVSKYDASGSLQWTQQWGSGEDDLSQGASTDALGNVYVAGYTRGVLGESNAGSHDAFISKLDASGIPQWTRQLGTSSGDTCWAVSTDQFGNSYITGSTGGVLEGTSIGATDVFVSKFDTAGALLWTQQWGTTSSDIGQGVSADKLGNIYVVGYSRGFTEIGAPVDHGFISKLDASGTLQWTQQLETSGYEFVSDVSTDNYGQIYITGSTYGVLGQTSDGNDDAFVSKYTAAGVLLWTQQLGSDGFDTGSGIAADGLGNFYVSGISTGSLSGANAGGADAFLIKFHDPSAVVPEPTSLAILSIGVITFASRWRRA